MKLKIALIISVLAFPLAAQAATGDSAAIEANQLYLKALVEENQGNLRAAQEALDKAISLAPDSAYLEKAAAELRFRQGQLNEASAHIEKALTLDPKNVKYHILAGQIHWALGNQEKAESRFSKAVELDPDEADALVNLALAVTPKNPEKAIRLYKDFLTRHPEELEIQERLAQLYNGMGDVEKAKAAWERALQIDPDSIRAHLASAQIAEVQHDTTTAITHYQSVLEQDPNNLPLLLRVGELRYRNDEMKQAYEAFSRAQSIAPNSASANFWLALLAENNGDWNQAITYLKPVAEKAAEPGVLLRLSYYYSQSGNRKEAIAILRKLSQDEPENTDFLRYLAVAYEQDNQLANAAATAEKLIAIDPTGAEHYFHAGTLYDRLNKFPKAEQALKKAIELDPEFHMALNYLGYSYADRGVKLDEAEQLLSAALTLDPDNSAYQDSMGWTYFQQKKYKNAENFLKQASEVGRDPLIWEHLGDAQLAQGESFKAALSYGASLRLDPKQPKVSAKLKKATGAIPDDKKKLFYLHRLLDDFSSVGSLTGGSKVEACQGRACAAVMAGLSYSSEGDLKIDVTGPLSVPAFLVVVSTSGNAQVGILDPNFEPYQSLVGSAVSAINKLWRGDVFRLALDKDAKTNPSIAIDGSGRPTEIRFADGALSLSKPDADFPFLPLVYEWRPSSGPMLRFTLVKPLLTMRRPSDEE